MTNSARLIENLTAKVRGLQRKRKEIRDELSEIKTVTMRKVEEIKEEMRKKLLEVKKDLKNRGHHHFMQDHVHLNW